MWHTFIAFSVCYLELRSDFSSDVQITSVGWCLSCPKLPRVLHWPGLQKQKKICRFTLSAISTKLYNLLQVANTIVHFIKLLGISPIFLFKWAEFAHKYIRHSGFPEFLAKGIFKLKEKIPCENKPRLLSD